MSKDTPVVQTLNVWSITLLSYLWYKHSGPRNPAVSITRPPECNLHSGMSGNNDVEHIYTYTVNVYIFSKYQIRYAMFTTRSTSHVHHTLNKPYLLKELLCLCFSSSFPFWTRDDGGTAYGNALPGCVYIISPYFSFLR